MHASDIDRAVLHRDLSGLQAAFCALVTGDDEIRGVRDQSHAARLFARVLAALYRDTSAMPEHITSFIDQETDGRLIGTTYAAGARAIRTALEVWLRFGRVSAPNEALCRPPAASYLLPARAISREGLPPSA